MNRRLSVVAATALTGVLVLSACSSSTDQAEPRTATGPVDLTFWSWTPNMDNVVALWNQAHPDIHVSVQKQASGDDLITKTITAAKAGNAPDLVQTEYQALPTLVSNGVLADIAKRSGSVKGQFAPGVWQQVSLGSEAVYAIPQDTAPLALFYRQDLFQQYGLTIPTTWTEFAEVARKLKQKDPSRALTTFSANDSGLFAGLAQQAGAKWWTTSGETWKVAIDDPATRKVADFWGGLVSEGVVDNQPMYTPAWSKALNDGTQIAWVSAVWAPGVLTSSAPGTKGTWAIAPLPQWTAGQNITGSWGGSATGVTAGAVKAGHADAAAAFAAWLNTDPTAVTALVKESGIYPAATSAQTGSALATAPDFFSNQADFYTRAAEIAKGTAPAAWGPNVNVAYSTFKDAFGRAAQSKGDFAAALTAMQQATVADLKKNGFATEG
ncbi:multiple sugar transport system substrate-binding protein [Streptomyces sp. TLI_053]|uniref:ABC transporter substrate-binding protein n=1 Tax=Streptomyces sp. TLI_053 TaxID=1855352 RepID=UPI000879ED55|nr:extracellular solute-binding protein [Streptomyces sp. TLI_053]SDS50852.1 multiple sugar transport system substrate-binding protein [Streptomyces sp. TLI_053]